MTPFLSRLQTSLSDFFRPEQGQNQPPEISSFVPSAPRTPSIGPTIRGILSSQGQPQAAQEAVQPPIQPSLQQPQQELSLEEILTLLQLLKQEGGL